MSSPAHDAVLILRGLEELYPEISFIERLRHCVETYPGENWGDAMSRGQISSKQWLLHALRMNHQTNLGKVAICGGWLGVLARLLLDDPHFNAPYVESIDLSLNATIVAGELNEEHIVSKRFLARVGDCTRREQTEYDKFDTIINTSCEHFDHWDEWWDLIPYGKLVVLQSNNFIEPEDHVNCVSCPEELQAMAEMDEFYFVGAMPSYKYTRFMTIGRK